MAPPRSPGPGATCTQSGRCFGQRFSKNEPASTPLGNRRSVMPRSPRCAEHHRRDPGVVVDDLALGEPGLGIQHLVEVRRASARARRSSTTSTRLGHSAGLPARRSSYAVLRFLGAAFLAGDFVARPASVLPWPRRQPARRRRAVRSGGACRASLAALTLRLERSHEVDDLVGSTPAAGGGTSSVSPAALRSMRSSTWSR